MTEKLTLVLRAIQNNNAEFIGESRWEKDGAYQVYKLDGKFYSIMVYDRQSVWLMDDTLEEIEEKDIKKFI